MKTQFVVLVITPPCGRTRSMPGYYEDADAAARRQTAVQAGLPEGWTVEIGGAG